MMEMANHTSSNVQCVMAKGSITQLPSGMNPLYPVEFDDIVQSLADGIVPEASQVMFPSMLSGGRANTVDNWNVPIKRVELGAPCR